MRTEYESGVVIEELPDDYDEPKPAAQEDAERIASNAEAGSSGAGEEEAGEGAEAEQEPQQQQQLLPPEDAELITDDGGVLIKTLEEGHGDLPPLHARCLGKQSTAFSNAKCVEGLMKWCTLVPSKHFGPTTSMNALCQQLTESLLVRSLQCTLSGDSYIMERYLWTQGWRRRAGNQRKWWLGEVRVPQT